MSNSFDNPPSYPGTHQPSAPQAGQFQYNTSMPMPMHQPSAPVMTSTAYTMQQTTYAQQPQLSSVSVITAQPVGQQHSTVIVQSVNGFSSYPHAATCLHCQRNITTSVRYESSCKTHFFAVFLFVFGCWCCCCIPYCMDSCKGAVHSCELLLDFYEYSTLNTSVLSTLSRPQLRRDARNFWILRKSSQTSCIGKDSNNIEKIANNTE